MTGKVVKVDFSDPAKLHPGTAAGWETVAPHCPRPRMICARCSMSAAAA
jgi:hypothetical protein